MSLVYNNCNSSNHQNEQMITQLSQLMVNPCTSYRIIHYYFK